MSKCLHKEATDRANNTLTFSSKTAELEMAVASFESTSMPIYLKE